MSCDELPTEGCSCDELCSMGPTCPGGMLAGLIGSGCWRSRIRVETHCAYCRKRVPDDTEGAIVLCSARCYGLYSTTAEGEHG